MHETLEAGMTEMVAPAIHFTRGSHRFEVYRTHSNRRVSNIGFYDGRPSVVAEGHIATRML
jgi:prepilin-type processing-associated H-X9-DG protein